MYKTFSFIGGGRITRILIERLQKCNSLPDKIIVCDPDEKVRNSLKELNIANLELLKGNHWEGDSDLVFLAVHPPAVKEVVPQIRHHFTTNTILISLVPVFQNAVLTQLSEGFTRIVRMIPNAPSIIGVGYNPAWFSYRSLRHNTAHRQVLA